MKIFRAEPIESELNNPRWARSTHKGWAVVRAEDEDQAVIELNLAFGIATTRQLGAKVLHPPWGDIELVNWTEIDEPQYPAEGEAGILSKA
jgi:hypothetical protein